MSIQDRLSEIEERHEQDLCDSSLVLDWAKDIPKLVKALREAVISLKFECGDRCAHQNPCNSKEALTEIERILNEEGEG